jgi:murein hydrolase activator
MSVACRLLILCVGLLVALSSTARSSRHIGRVQSSIEHIRSGLNQDHRQRQHLLLNLKDVETQNGHAKIKVDRLRKRLRTQHRSIGKLQRSQARLAEQLQAQQQLLSSQMVAAYLLHQQPAIKLLLDPSSETKVSRMLAYYKYIYQARAKTIQRIQLLLNKIQNNKQKLMHSRTTLLNLNKVRSKQLLRLHRDQTQRQQLIRGLNAKIKTREQRLSILENDKIHLESTLKNLSEKKDSTVGNYTVLRRGKLPWPTRGRILSSFGRAVASSELKSTGVLIQAPMGRKVRAVLPGTVIFSRWMRGYGLLIIVDNGHGYMTLYGRNESLYKKRGDVIKRGEIISAVGNSGGYQKSALYFAIRHNAKPVNPSKWCG